MIIDTEAHVLYRVWPVESDPSGSLVERYRWHEHSGDLLIAEMDRADVDQVFLIAYDGYDFGYFMERLGGGPDDYWGGRTYARRFAAQYPERIHLITTLRHPRIPQSFDQLKAELESDAIGVKVFPSYLGLAVLDNSLLDAYRLCADLGRLVIFGLEDTQVPRTPSLAQHFEDIATLSEQFPSLRIQLNHGGCVELDSNEAGALFDVVRAHPNVYVSTSVLSGVTMEWRHGWRYPYPTYLDALRRYVEELPVTSLMWASDWPWYEHYGLYPQLVDAIRYHADFLTEDDKALYLGGNAVRLLAELGIT